MIGYAGFLGVVTAYCGLHVAIRLLVLGGAEHDEAEQLLLGQTLALGYGLDPPLYTWLQHLLFRTVGAGVLALTLLKHLCLLAIYVSSLLTARLLLRDTALAVTAALSLWLVPQVAWESHRDLTHSVLAAALTSATTGVFLLLARKPHTWLYAVLGVSLGLGTLAKYNVLAFAAAFTAAALLTPQFRRVLLDRRVLLALAIGAVLVAPHAAWVAAQRDAIATAALAKVAPHSLSVDTAFTGLRRLAWALLRLLAPPVLVAALFVPGLVRPRSRASAEQRLLERYLAILLAGLALLVLLVGGTAFKGRWLQPLLVLIPLPLFLRIQAAAPTPRRVRALTWTLLGCGVLWVVVRLAQVWVGPHVGHYLRLHLPIRAVAEGIRAAGFERGTLVAEDTVLGGALRLHFPDSRILSPKFPALVVPPPTPPGRLVLAWRRSGETGAPPALTGFVTERLGASDPTAGAATVLDVPWPDAPSGTYRVVVVLVPEASQRR